MPKIEYDDDDDRFYLIYDDENHYWFAFDFVVIRDNCDYYDVILFADDNPIAIGSMPYERFASLDGYMDILVNHPDIIHKE